MSWSIVHDIVVLVALGALIIVCFDLACTLFQIHADNKRGKSK